MNFRPTDEPEEAGAIEGPAPAFPARRHFFWLLLGLVVFLGLGLGDRGLNDPDEGRYANIALQFLQPGADRWEPHMSGLAHYDKPPLTYWVTALSFWVFGQSEFAARLPSYLGALLALVGLGWTAARLYSRAVAWWAMLICGTLGQFWVMARFLSPDMLLTGWCSLAVGAWAEARHRQGDWRFWGLSLICWTLAWWTKATAALVPLAGLVAGLALTRDVAGLRALRPGRLLLGILVLGAPWYLRMMVEHPETVSFFFGRELAGRIVGHADGRRGPIYYHVVLVFLLWLPWLPALGAAWLARRKSWPGRAWHRRLAAVGVEGWLVLVGLAIFSLIASKLPSYTLPLAPWAALLLARSVVWLHSVASPRVVLRLAAGCTASTLAVATGAMLILPKYESHLGAASSVRPVAQALRAAGAESVYLDRYWPGMEFYFGEQVRYVPGGIPRQRTTDSGRCRQLGEPHFLAREEWLQVLARDPATNVWVAHYARRKESPFLDPEAPAARTEKQRWGSFVLWRIR